EEIIGIVMRLDSDHTIPAVLVCLRDAILLIATHEIHVYARFHRRSKPVKNLTNPADMQSVGGWIRPIRQQVQNEWSAAVPEGSFTGIDQCRYSTKVRQLNLRSARRNRNQRLEQTVNRAVIEMSEVAGLGVVALPMRESRVRHRLQIKKRDHSAGYRLGLAHCECLSQTLLP